MIIYDQSTGEQLVIFDTYIENSYHKTGSVAYEPLEQGSFSSDSKQNSPFVITVTGIKVINGNATPNSLSESTVNEVKTILQRLVGSSRLVYFLLQPMINQLKNNTNSQYYQYGEAYENLNLVDLSYQNTPDQLELRATMTFQQIRLTNTEYTQSQNTANPENSATQNQGQKQPKPITPASFQSILNSIFGVL